jgi:hypothetical protein
MAGGRTTRQLDTLIILSPQPFVLAELYRHCLGLGGVSPLFRMADLQATFQRLVAAGARVRYPPAAVERGVTLASVYDPDSNILGLSQEEAS